LASSSTYVAGWESPIIDNTTNKDEDILVSGKITVGNTAITAGTQIRVYAVGMVDDSTWPAPFDGTAGAETIDVSVLPAHAKLGAVISVDDVEDKVYYFGPFSLANLFGGLCPAKCCLFVVHATNDALAAAGGNQVTIKGVKHNVALS
jgi:hypothetical protein